MIYESLARIGFALLTASFFIVCDSLSANWGKTGNITSLIIMFNLAPFGYILFGKLNESTSLSIASGLVNMTIIIGTVLVGIFVFHDTLSTRQIIGLVSAVLAVALMS